MQSPKKIDDRLKEYLTLAVRGEITEQPLCRLVQLSRSIVKGFLLHKRSSLIHLADRRGQTIDDLSSDCVAEAFARNAADRFHFLERFVSSLDREIESIPSEELLLAYRVFLARIAEAQLARCYAEEDPAGAHIYRNIRLALKSSAPLAINRSSSGLILIPTIEPTLEHLPPFPIEELSALFVSGRGDAGSIPDLLVVLHRVFIGQKSYRRSAFVLDVVRIFKEFYTRTDSGEAEMVIEETHSFEFEQICGEVLSAIKAKIVESYLMKGKLIPQEANAVFLAFEDMLSDWRSTGSQEPSLYNYMKPHLKIDEAAFDSRLRVKMTYLLQFAKDEFKSRLFREL